VEGGNLLLSGGGFDPGCPVRILQGMREADVPWVHFGSEPGALTIITFLNLSLASN
jgi:hypothetical protein